MPIPLPNLDDRTFADLTAETRALIPGYAPEWTDHNASDPGITLIELFAWLSEILIFRLNRVSRDSEARFFELLGAALSPAQPARVTLEVTASNLGGEALIIPRGTPFASLAPGQQHHDTFRGYS
jgi:predicted phage baseplate assembly protein